MSEKTTVTNFIKLCKTIDVEILKLNFEAELRGRMKAVVQIKGSLLDISEKLAKLVEGLSPFINDKFFGKWLNISGTMNLHEFTGNLIVEVGFKGIGIEID